MLSAHCGYLYPDRLRDEMGFRQFRRWQWFYEVFPFGEERADLRMARHCVATLAPHSKKRRPKEADFMFRFVRKEPPSPEGLKRKVMLLHNLICNRMDKGRA